MSEVALNQDFLGAFGVLERDGCLLLAANRRRLSPSEPFVRTYDLPGGRVEPGERIEEALVREWREEAGVEIEVGRFLMLQEGVRLDAGQRRYAWRSFFFAVNCAAMSAADVEPTPQSEVEGLLWIPVTKLESVLTAPYHQAYLRFRAGGDAFQRDTW